jgi:transposase
MEQSEIFSATLGLSTPWLVTSVSFAAEGNRLDIAVDFARGSIFRFPCCGYERQTGSEDTGTWYHQDYFHRPTYLHARVPRITCCGDVIFPVERPRSRAGSKFALIS